MACDPTRLEDQESICDELMRCSVCCTNKMPIILCELPLRADVFAHLTTGDVLSSSRCIRMAYREYFDNQVQITQQSKKNLAPESNTAVLRPRPHCHPYPSITTLPPPPPRRRRRRHHLPRRSRSQSRSQNQNPFPPPPSELWPTCWLHCEWCLAHAGISSH